jgi:lipopolysaccharide export system protein LptC
MSDRFGAWFPLALLAVLSALTFWLDRLVQLPSSSQTEEVKHDPDYIVDGLDAVRMDPQGRVKHTLLAQKMTHFPDDDITVLREPKLVTYSQGHAPVTVTSRHARVSGNGEDVYFEEQVRVVRAPDGGQSALVLETDYLHVIPDANVAKTDRAVRISTDGAVVTASGLELNSETRILNLQGRVNSTYSRGSAAQQNAP